MHPTANQPKLSIPVTFFNALRIDAISPTSSLYSQRCSNHDSSQTGVWSPDIRFQRSFLMECREREAIRSESTWLEGVGGGRKRGGNISTHISMDLAEDRESESFMRSLTIVGVSLAGKCRVCYFAVWCFSWREGSDFESTKHLGSIEAVLSCC